MSKNRGVVYLRPGKVEVRDIDDPKLEAPDGRRIEHGVILKVISTNICGSDQHMVRGRTTAMPGLVLGHEITGEIIEKGIDVEMLDVGDIVSVPFNVACGRCRCCKSQDTGVCLTVNPARAGGAYGYVDMGGWIGGQARYVTIPYADFNLLKIPDRDKAMAKIRDLTMLSDILPTGFHGAVRAGVGVGSTVYVAGAGPVGLAAAASARILGAAVVMVGDFNKDRLAHAARVGFEPIDLSKSDRLGDMIAQVVGSNEVDSAIDAVGFEARGHSGGEQPAIVLNQMMEITAPQVRSVFPASTSRRILVPSTMPPSTAICRSASASAGPRRSLSTPARRRCSSTIGSSCRRSCTTGCRLPISSTPRSFRSTRPPPDMRASTTERRRNSSSIRTGTSRKPLSGYD